MSLIERLKERNFREPYLEDGMFVLVHDPCGREFPFTDWTPPEVVDRDTLDHALTCTASLPLRRAT